MRQHSSHSEEMVRGEHVASLKLYQYRKLCYYLIVIYMQTRYTIKTGALALYFILVVVFAVIYYNMGYQHFNNMEQNSYVDSMYFTLVTMASVGYGDIQPKTKLAKMIVSVNLIIVILLVGVLMINY